MFKSIDGGVSWDEGVFAFGGDKVWLAVDRTGGEPGFSISSARPPTAQQLSEIERVDHAITIDIRRATRAQPPTAQQQGQVERVHGTVLVRISRTGPDKLVGAPIHSAISDSRKVVEVAVGQWLSSCKIGIGVRVVVSRVYGG